jgi:hypothetical protein
MLREHVSRAKAFESCEPLKVMDMEFTAEWGIKRNEQNFQRRWLSSGL